MAKSDLQNPAFTDENKARETLEAIRWPDGPYCPHCGNADQEKIAKGLGKVSRAGLYYCASCNGQFTVTIGTVMEDTKIPLSKWLFAMHLLGASKKGMSALQLSRMLGVTYKSAWFLCHRIREAMTPATRGPIGGQNRVVEADETMFGGKAKNRAFAKKEPKKHAVLTLVDRDGDSHSFHIANVKAKTLRETIVKVASRKSYLATDELASYEKLGKEFSGHGTVNQRPMNMYA
jgi:transposase-like protein